MGRTHTHILHRHFRRRKYIVNQVGASGHKSEIKWRKSLAKSVDINHVRLHLARKNFRRSGKTRCKSVNRTRRVEISHKVAVEDSQCCEAVGGIKFKSHVRQGYSAAVAPEKQILQIDIRLYVTARWPYRGIGRRVHFQSCRLGRELQRSQVHIPPVKFRIPVVDIACQIAFCHEAEVGSRVRRVQLYLCLSVGQMRFPVYIGIIHTPEGS